MKRAVLTVRFGFLRETYQDAGLRACARKIFSFLRMSVPIWVLGRRTTAGVAAYFDLLTDEARVFYGDSFHFGYFGDGAGTLAGAVHALTDLVADLSDAARCRTLLDVGCGICAPAVRIAHRSQGEITAIDLSREQVRQAILYVNSAGLTNQIHVRRANALKLPFEAAAFDGVIAIEVAGNACVSERNKQRFVFELFRVLRAGGSVGFADLVFRSSPSRADDQIVRALLYHRGSELITDWPALFDQAGFTVERRRDILPATMKTWNHALLVYERRYDEVVRRYGQRGASKTIEALRQLPRILEQHASYIVFAARKP